MSTTEGGTGTAGVGTAGAGAEGAKGEDAACHHHHRRHDGGAGGGDGAVPGEPLSRKNEALLTGAGMVQVRGDEKKKIFFLVVNFFFRD